MKTLILILFLSVSASAQIRITVSDYNIQMKADTLTVRQAFATLRLATPASMWFYDLYVIKDGKKYYRPGFSFISRRKAFVVNEGWRKVRI